MKRLFPAGGQLRVPIAIIGAAVLLMLLLSVVTVIFALQTAGLSKRIAQQNEAIVGQLRNDSGQINFLKQNLLLLAEDANSVRDTLKLPELPFPILAPEPATAEASTADQSDAPFLAGLGELLRARDRLISETKFNTIIASPLLAQAIAQEGFREDRSHRLAVSLWKDDFPYFTVSIDPVSQTVLVVDFLGKELRLLKLDSRFLDFVRERSPALEAHFRRLAADVARLKSVYADSGLSSFLTRHNLSLGPLTKGPIYYGFELKRGTSSLLAVRLNERTLAVYDGEKRYPNVSAFLSGFEQDLAGLDLRTPLQRRVDASRAEIVALAKDRDFLSLLDSRHLKLVTTPRKNLDYYLYDILDSEGNRIGSFGVERRVGRIDLLDSQGVIVSTLETARLESSGAEKKN